MLRVYANHADARRVRFEQVVLAQLAQAGLPFALPVPLPTVSGGPFARIAVAGGTGDGEVLATLAPLLPGAHPDRGDLEQARAGGEALGLLDVALASLPPMDDVEGAVGWRSYGDLAHCHPLVPDPRTAILELPVTQEVRGRLVRTFDTLLERIPVLYAALPRQLVHEDYAPDNLLMQGARVTAVLDFEFCALDLRAMDLTVALSWWPGEERFGTGEEWPILRAVAAGYGRQLTLSAEEAQAMPSLYLLRAYTSLIHRLGRHRQGLSSLGAVTDRAYAAIAREEWIQAHGGRLVEAVLAGTQKAG